MRIVQIAELEAEFVGCPLTYLYTGLHDGWVVDVSLRAAID